MLNPKDERTLALLVGWASVAIHERTDPKTGRYVPVQEPRK